MSETATPATAMARSAYLPVLKNRKQADTSDLAVTIAEVAVSHTALVWYPVCLLVVEG